MFCVRQAPVSDIQRRPVAPVRRVRNVRHAGGVADHTHVRRGVLKRLDGLRVRTLAQRADHAGAGDLHFGAVRIFADHAVGFDALVNTEDPDYPLVQYLAGTEAKLEKLFEDPYLIRTPVVRNGKQATVGYCPEVWKDWK